MTMKIQQPNVKTVQPSRREGQKSVAGVNIWTRTVKIRKMGRRRQVQKGNSSVPGERTLWKNKGNSTRAFCPVMFRSTQRKMEFSSLPTKPKRLKPLSARNV